jgi:hypothetical protein
MIRALPLILLLAGALSLPAATLTSLSGDTFGVPRQFNLIDPATTSASSPFSLGDASTGFTGGLTWVESDSRYWTIYETGGETRLASFDLTGPASLIDSTLSLPAGLWRGLTYSPWNQRFYALYSDGASPYTFQEIDVAGGAVNGLFQTPFAVFGGMTYRGPGQFTALLTNAGGTFQLHAVDAAAQTITPFGTTFDINMNGGLAWDTATMASYFAIGSDMQGNSSLYGIVADGSGWGSQFALGGGYFYGALAYRGDPAPGGPGGAVPEPSTLWLMAPALLALLSWRGKSGSCQAGGRRPSSLWNYGSNGR